MCCFFYFSPVKLAINQLLNDCEVSAILLGKHEAYDDHGTGKQPLDILLEQLDDAAIPILSGIDCCHTHPMLPLAIGKKIRVDFDDRTITSIEDWFVNK